MFKKFRQSISLGKASLLENPRELLDLKTSDSPHKPSLRSTRFKSFLETRRITTRPISIIRSTDSDILHFKEDTSHSEKHGKNDLLSIPILPADEMDALTSEIKVWKKNRRCFMLIFSIVQLFAAVTFTVGLLFTFIWFNGSSPSGPTNYGRPGSDEQNIHMILQIINAWLLTIVVLMFRLAPNTTTKNIILTHSALSFFGMGAFILSNYYAIVSNETFLGFDSHFYTFHGWIGLVTASVFFFALLSGALFAYCPSKFLRTIHAPIGSGTLFLCGAAIVTGFFRRAADQLGKDYVIGGVPAILTNVFGVVLLFQFILVRITLSDFIFRRRPRPQWDVIVHRNLEAIEEVFIDVHHMYENFETWVKQINTTRMRALRVPRTGVGRIST